MAKNLNKYHLKKSSDSPEILLDNAKGIMQFTGRSLPENAKDLYDPVFNWIEKLSKSDLVKLKIVFRFDYLNSASTQMILQMLEQIKALYGDKFNELVSIEWHYFEKDSDILEAGKDFEHWAKVKIEKIKRDQPPPVE